MSPSRSSKLPPLTIDVIDDRAGEKEGSRIAAFAAACGSRPGLRLHVELDKTRLSVDAERIERLGPRIEAAASAHGLTIRIPELDAELVPGGLDAAPSRTWIAIGRAVLEAEIARDGGGAQSFEPFRYLRVDLVDGRRQVLEDLPPMVEGSQPIDDAYMSEPGFLGDIGPTKYDDADWHVGAAIEAGQPDEHAFTHIGLYLAWLIRHDLVDRSMLPRKHVAALKGGEMTGSDLADDVDGKLISDMLTAQGRAFTDYYYPKYLRDFSLVFDAEPDYGVSDTGETYSRIAPVLDGAFRGWLGSGRPGPEPDDAD